MEKKTWKLLFGVQGLGFGVAVLAFRVFGSGFKAFSFFVVGCIIPKP